MCWGKRYTWSQFQLIETGDQTYHGRPNETQADVPTIRNPGRRYHYLPTYFEGIGVSALMFRPIRLMSLKYISRQNTSYRLIPRSETIL
jgi:hypothetical protein